MSGISLSRTNVSIWKYILVMLFIYSESICDDAVVRYSNCQVRDPIVDQACYTYGNWIVLYEHLISHEITSWWYIVNYWWSAHSTSHYMNTLYGWCTSILPLQKLRVEYQFLVCIVLLCSMKRWWKRVHSQNSMDLVTILVLVLV